MLKIQLWWNGQKNGWRRACSRLCAERAAHEQWKLGEGHDATIEPLPQALIDITNPEIHACAFCYKRLEAY